jgi:LacI family transcriptional regulator
MARLHGVQIALAESKGNYDLVFYHVATPERYDQRLISIAEQRAIEGLLIMAMDTTPEQRDMLNNARIVFVGIHDRIVTEWPSIGMDNLPGGEMATCYLLDLGHTRIAYIGDMFPFDYGYSVSEPRYNGYVKALVERGIPVNPDYVQFGPHGRDIAYQLTRNLLALPEPPTAIFSMSDVQALGCLAAIRDAGLHVPDDISLIGFDDVEMSSLIGLTTIRQHLDRAGCMGMEYLLKLLGDESLKDHYVTGLPRLPSFEVIERQTTRRIR